MPDSHPPRVRVLLPREVPARLVRWRQGPDGQWWAELTIHAPADAVQQVGGEDYSRVPREPAHGAPYALVAPKVGPGEKATAELHRADCIGIPAASTSTLRVTPVHDPAMARGLLDFDDTTACTACQPKPGQADAPPQDGET